MHFEQPQYQITVGPDVPRARGRRPVPCHGLGRLLASESTLGRIVAQITRLVLEPGEILRDSLYSRSQLLIARARRRLRRRVEPLARVLAVPVACRVPCCARGAEQCDRRARLIDDESG